MKKPAIALLSIVFVALIACSVQSVTADHSLGGQGIFKDEQYVNDVSSVGSKYQIHLQVIVRNADDQLVSVSEVAHGNYIPHEITDYFFDEYFGKKEIITIDKMRYEKAQLTQFVKHVELSTDRAYWSLNASLKSEEHGNEQGIVFIPVFNAPTSNISLEEDDSFTLRWIILRDLPS